MTEARFFWVYVFRSGLGDCTNGGVSATHDRLPVLCNEGNGPYGTRGTVDLDDPPEELCVLVHGAFGSVHLVPYEPWKEGRWLMHGGNYAATSDAPFYNALSEIVSEPYAVGAVAIHDRIES